jgi:hypothetical protein
MSSSAILALAGAAAAYKASKSSGSDGSSTSSTSSGSGGSSSSDGSAAAAADDLPDPVVGDQYDNPATLGISGDTWEELDADNSGSVDLEEARDGVDRGLI